MSMRVKNCKNIIILLLLLGGMFANAQNKLSGTVFELGEKGNKSPLPYANVQWLGTTKSVATKENGTFSIEIPSSEKDLKLVVSSMGYQTDTLSIEENQSFIEVLLSVKVTTLSNVDIVEKQDASYISRLNPVKTEVITTDGLCRLACCNLAESFENSATVDVGYSDAISGARQIQMLGLTGVYSQLLLENIPFIKGLSAPFGLGYVPGSFMESIQISKGVSSVINGYETMTGQINIEYKKPKTSDPFFLNAYLNSDLKGEVNALSAYEFNDKLSTMSFLHGSYSGRELDHVGHDNFMDMPKSWQINFVNRWDYENENYRNISLLNYVTEHKTGGQMGFERNLRTYDTTGLYGIGVDNQRLQIFTKNGYLLDNKSSVALQLSGVYFEQKAFYGLNDYKGNEADLYANLLYENSFSPKHKLTTGFSFQWTHSRENYDSENIYTLLNISLNQTEILPGVFAQYTFSLDEKLSLIAGFRYDYNTFFRKSVLTPRLNLKWSVFEKTTLRASAGKGSRTAYIFAENFGLMASSRQFVIQPDLNLFEEAWNYGFNIVQEIPFFGKRKAVFTFDAYRTDFIHEVNLNLDRSAHQAIFSNLDGKSYSNSLQADLKIEVLKGFNVTLAGRYNDVKTTIDGNLMDKPYISKWKGLLVLSYATKYNKWIFDLTTQLNGSCRLPNTNGAREEYTKPYVFMLGQITRKFKSIDIYAGCENITGFVQTDPIIAADRPFSQDFDASVIYAPMMSRLFYAGLRWTIK